MAQGTPGAAGVRHVWAGAGLRRVAYRGAAYCAASGTACIYKKRCYLSLYQVFVVSLFLKGVLTLNILNHENSFK